MTTPKPLNVVPGHVCPTCFRAGPMTVWTGHVSWECGHAQALPPLPSERAAPSRKASR